MTDPEMVKMTQLITAAIEEMKTPLARQRCLLLARAARMQYLAHVAEGFDPAQALQLVIAKL